MDGLDSLLFVNFGDLFIYQKSISFVEFVTVIRINASLFYSATTQTEVTQTKFSDKFWKKPVTSQDLNSEIVYNELYSEPVQNTLLTIFLKDIKIRNHDVCVNQA